MARKIPDRWKRLSYVSRNSQKSSKDTYLLPSDEDIDEIPSRKKVRRDLSLLNLRKESEYFKVDEDHIYSKESQENIETIKCRMSERIPRVYLTRSIRSSKSQGEDTDAGSWDKTSETMSTGKRVKCSSKNAVLARINREKKKQYISSLENSNKTLQQQNDEISIRLGKQEKVIQTLQREVIYLKSLLANSKEISEILTSLKKSTGLPVTSSLYSLVCNEEDTVERGKVNEIGTPYSEDFKVTLQPKVKNVTCGTNFPIMQEDVNLGYFNSGDDRDELDHNLDEESKFSISGESDVTLDNVLLKENDFDFESSVFNYSVDPNFNFELFNAEDDELLKTEKSGYHADDVGLCLHINKRKISVELCAICNSKAQCH